MRLRWALAVAAVAAAATAAPAPRLRRRAEAVGEYLVETTQPTPAAAGAPGALTTAATAEGAAPGPSPCADGNHGCDTLSTTCMVHGEASDPYPKCVCREGFLEDPESLVSCVQPSLAPTSAPSAAPVPVAAPTLAPTSNLERPSVTLSSYAAGAENVTAEFRFVPSNEIPRNGRVAIGFPRLPDGFLLDEDPLKVDIGCSSGEGMVQAGDDLICPWQIHPSSIEQAGECTRVIIRVLDTPAVAVPADGIAEFTVSGLTNSITSGSTGQFCEFSTMDGATKVADAIVLDEASAEYNSEGRPAPLAIEPARFAVPVELALSKRAAGETGKAEITFVPDLPVPKGGT